MIGSFSLSVFANSIETYNGVGGVVTATPVPNTEDNYQIEAVANTAQGYEFVRWTDGTTTNPRLVTPDNVTADGYYNAIFAKTLDVHQPNGDVQIELIDQTNPKAPVYSLQAVPKTCVIFSGWMEIATISNPLTYVEKDGTRTPIFSISGSGSIHAEYEQGNGGVVSLEAIPNTCNQYKLTATANDGYEFLYWLDGNSDNPRTITCVNKYMEFGATFARSADIHLPAGNVQVDVEDPVIPSYILTANEICGTFSKWNNSATSNPLRYTPSEGDRFPIFNLKNILVEHENHEGGEVQLTKLTCGFALKAKANAGYRFVKWNTGQTVDSIVVDYDEGEYYASFIPTGYTAQRGTQVYSSVQQAIDAVSSDPVTLLANSDENIHISSKVSLSGDNLHIGDLTIAPHGDLTLSSSLNIRDLYLNTVSGASSQLHNSNALNYRNAYFDVQLEPEKSSAVPYKWYAFAVPFEVDVLSGVRKTLSPNQTLTNKVDYLIWEYDGTMRATTKDNGWKQIEQGTLSPGNFYMLGVTSTDNSWRFVRKEGGLGGSATLSVSEFPSDYKNRGWNALANSQLVYASASIDGIRYAQVYDNASVGGKYSIVALASASFVMACPFFIQAKEDDVLLLTENQSGTLYAPLRNETNDELFCEVRLLKNGKTMDNLFLTANKEASDMYEIGKDVIKIMGDTTDSYIWAEGYGYQLCAQDLPLKGEVVYSLNLYASTSDTYILSAPMGYLYYNGCLVADLSKGDYTVSLNQGQNKGYTLHIGEYDLSTNLEEESMLQGVSKYIYNNSLYILNNGKLYNAQGNIIR